MPDNVTNSLPDFRSLGLIEPVLLALDDVGYELPSPIQAMTIPHVLAGTDILGQAQTGTGKTAAFALPLLSRINLKNTNPQVLVLTPTRELAIQVAEAFQRYASHMKGFHVLPIYGGQEYSGQLRQLKRGVHVVVGTPGRVMDHMRKKTLKLDALSCLVLDEADEMLRMGFIDDIEWILEQTPSACQIALFSATMPEVIRRIARKHLKNPEEITIKVRTTTAESIHQRYWPVSGLHKLDALTRILEAEIFDGMLIFVRTKLATTELAEKLTARGYAVAALNGDIPQKQRENTVDRLKSGKLDIVVATDVAARGLDVERISHVINYDIPHDTESYVHRIGRTGRFGRKGEAILFIAPREKNMLHAIERATRQRIDLMELPSTEMLNNKRIDQFTQRITDTLAKGQLEFYSHLIERYQQETNIPAIEIASALASLVQGSTPLLLKEPRQETPRSKNKPVRGSKPERPKSTDRGNRKQIDKPEAIARTSESRVQKDTHKDEFPRATPKNISNRPKRGMERFRIEVGSQHGIKPGNIVGAITAEAGLTSKNIDQIAIHEAYSTVDLPEGMPRDVFRDLKNIKLSGQRLNISKIQEDVQFSGTDRRPESGKGPARQKHSRHSRKKDN